MHPAFVETAQPVHRRVEPGGDFILEVCNVGPGPRIEPLQGLAELRIGQLRDGSLDLGLRFGARCRQFFHEIDQRGRKVLRFDVGRFRRQAALGLRSTGGL